jgi:hypothetical protein
MPRAKSPAATPQTSGESVAKAVAPPGSGNGARVRRRPGASRATPSHAETPPASTDADRVKLAKTAGTGGQPCRDGSVPHGQGFLELSRRPVC